MTSARGIAAPGGPGSGNLEDVVPVGRGERRRAPGRARGATLVAGTVAALALVGPGPAGASPRLIVAGPAPVTIRAEQQALVNLNHQLPIGEASFAVSGLQARLAADRQALAVADAAAGAAGTELASASARLRSDQASLQVASGAVEADRARLQSDREALKGIAVALYTGQLTDPQPAGLHALVSDQRTVIATTEVEAITSLIGSNLRRDLATFSADRRRRDGLSKTVDDDRAEVGSAGQQKAAAATRAATATAAVTTDTGRLAGAQAQLAAARAALAADLAAVAGPDPTAAGITVVGGSALDAGELAAWYRSQGYTDLTSAPIDKLASWYIQAGREEGIRGDVAFAQAVLETGGFSSPDSVQFNNYAGIGHCDTCATGWDFPSAQGGVLGQEQLLRIFAAGAPPAGSPSPVLPSLVPSEQGRRGCCSTWQALTGVWATDPTYGSQIMDIYQRMLSFALSGGGR